MTGPALRKVDSHSSIHDAALGEAAQLTELLRRCLEAGEHDKAFEAACITLEHWETRTLAHADAEEEGLYKEIVEQDPALNVIIASLIRDHDLMRRMADDIRGILATEEVNQAVLNRFETMILIDEVHNHDEESLLASLGIDHE
ncbi:hemerythrin domain-containing protein [Paenibacillus sp. GCM10028914]|uniref:hemerythrin domain-containing protein n=1 Tax=Paenibacillus sp. GCM10028914 TaxID=3273416 RepID=UPI00360FEFA2